MHQKESTSVPSLRKIKNYLKVRLNSQITIKKIINPAKKIHENPQELHLQDKKPTQQDLQEKCQIDVKIASDKNEQTFAHWSDSMFIYRKMEHVRINRGRIFDWFVDICFIFSQSWRTLWSAMGILDKMIIERGKVLPQNIHLYGMTSIFIASKYHETENISLHTIINCIGHNKYTREQILKCEEQIFTWICIVRNDSSFHFPTIQERVFEVFPELPHIWAKKIMIQMFFCMQEPQMLIEERKEDFTVKELTKKVGDCILQGQRFRGCQLIEAYFSNEYKCCNIRLRGLQLKL